MKQCPECNRVYDDETLKYCLDDGTPLVYGPAEPKTAILESENFRSERPTQLLDPPKATAEPSPLNATQGEKRNWLIAGAVGLVLVAAIGVGGYWLYGDRDRSRSQIESKH